MQIPSFGPKCPNHGCPLVGMGFPMPPKGEARCEFSGAVFEYEIEADSEKLVKDKNGNLNLAVKWKINGSD